MTRRVAPNPPALGAAAGAALLLLALVALGTDVGSRLDEESWSALWSLGAGGQVEALDNAFDAVRLQVAFAAGFVVALALRRRAADALTAAAIVALSIGFAEVLKRAWPEVGLRAHGSEPTFPSGHVAAATAICFVALVLVDGRHRRLALLLCAATAAAVGVAAAAEGGHLPSDVLGGHLLAVAIASGVVAVRQLAVERGLAVPPRATAGGLWLAVAAAAVAGGALLVGSLLPGGDGLGYVVVDRPSTAAATVALAAAAALLVWLFGLSVADAWDTAVRR